MSEGRRGGSAALREKAMACSGSSQVEKGTGSLPCLRRLKRSSSAAATIRPSTTIAAAGSGETALTPRTRIGEALLREALLTKHACGAPGARVSSVCHSGSWRAADQLLVLG